MPIYQVKHKRLYEICGWIGSGCLAACGAPEAFRALSAAEYDTSLMFVGLWFVGEVFLLVPAVLLIKRLYVIFNILFNILFIGIILARELGVIGRMIGG